MGENTAIAFDPAAAMPAPLKAALERDAGAARAEAAEAAAAEAVPYSTRGWGELHGMELSRVRKLRDAGNKKIGACPACEEEGHDGDGNHLAIFEDGRFACIKYPGAEGAAHRKRIWELIGLKHDTWMPAKAPAPAVLRKAEPQQAVIAATLEAAAMRCCPPGYTLAALYEYPKAGAPFAGAARYEHATEAKQFRQFTVVPGGWACGAPKDADGKQALWPLYQQDRVLMGQPVWVVEGEKAQGALAGLGFNCTTSKGGACAASTSDWAALAGCDVRICPDRDEPGEKYAAAVTGILQQLDPPARVRIVRLPGIEELPEGADIVDWQAARPGLEREAAVALIEAGVPERDAEPDVPVADVLDETYGTLLLEGSRGPAINQMRLAAEYVRQSGVVHDPTHQRFFAYEAETGLWRHRTDDVTLERISECFSGVLPEGERESLLAKRTVPLLKGLREAARGIAEKRDVFANRPAAIHVADGMLVIEDDGTVRLEPFSEHWYSRNRSEIRWNPEADCTRFKSELILSAMDADDAGLIQRYAGQCLLGINLSQTFLITRGTAGGGKSTLANVIEGVIGRHNVSELRVAQLTERFELVRFVGRTLLSGKDVPGDFLNSKPAHVIKALVGGDTLEGEAKHGNESFAIPGIFNVMISTNTRLRVRLDCDQGAWRRRMLIVDYARPKVAKPIPGFDAQLLREEGEGILRWAVDGAVKLLQELREFGSIQLTEAQSRRVDDLLSESDSVRSFVRECVVACHGGEVTIQDLTTAYRDYCEARDWEPLRERQFQAELPDAMLDFHRAGRRNDIRSGGKAARGFRGVRLQPYGVAIVETGANPHTDASDGLSPINACGEKGGEGEGYAVNPITPEQTSGPSGVGESVQACCVDAENVAMPAAPP